ncbi:uncharacterized protein LOC120354004 isoform X1 [Nilaparvata lugens]|uniref:uncharacterized protein LOC120354004 isoform X1 n=1 Tax=Nilaparvata lugens TaxID=108931 RepID=UPI00193CC279|nr:uncharacterized protein LOC120354004 isoform X1 [Nilaparvata lugens]
MNNTNIRFILMLLSSGPLLWVNLSAENLDVEDVDKLEKIASLIMGSYKEAKHTLLSDAIQTSPEYKNLLLSKTIPDLIKTEQDREIFELRVTRYIECFVEDEEDDKLVFYVNLYISELSKNVNFENQCIDEEIETYKFLKFLKEQNTGNDEDLNSLIRSIERTSYIVDVAMYLVARIELAQSYMNVPKSEVDAYEVLYQAITEKKFKNVLESVRKWDRPVVKIMNEVIDMMERIYGSLESVGLNEHESE